MESGSLASLDKISFGWIMSRILQKQIMSVMGLEVEVFRKQIKHLYIRILPADGHIEVSAPVNMADEEIARCIEKKSEWILKKLESLIHKKSDECFALSSGQIHYVLGRPYRLEVCKSDYSSVKIKEESLMLYVSEPSSRRLCFNVLSVWYSGILEEILQDMLPKWEDRFGLSIEKLTIKVMKTRWGSCNAKRRRISINLDVARFPKKYIEYVLVHEMAHIFEPNHGPGFKKIMNKMLPGWQEIDRDFRKLSPSFYLMKP